MRKRICRGVILYTKRVESDNLTTESSRLCRWAEIRSRIASRVREYEIRVYPAKQWGVI